MTELVIIVLAFVLFGRDAAMGAALGILVWWGMILLAHVIGWIRFYRN